MKYFQSDKLETRLSIRKIIATTLIGLGLASMGLSNATAQEDIFYPTPTPSYLPVEDQTNYDFSINYPAFDSVQYESGIGEQATFERELLQQQMFVEQGLPLESATETPTSSPYAGTLDTESISIATFEDELNSALQCSSATTSALMEYEQELQYYEMERSELFAFVFTWMQELVNSITAAMYFAPSAILAPHDDEDAASSFMVYAALDAKSELKVLCDAAREQIEDKLYEIKAKGNQIYDNKSRTAYILSIKRELDNLISCLKGKGITKDGVYWNGAIAAKERQYSYFSGELPGLKKELARLELELTFLKEELDSFRTRYKNAGCDKLKK